MIIKYGIVAVYRKAIEQGLTTLIYHFVGFTSPPSFQDYTNLYAELMEDDEFGLNTIMSDLVLLPATEEMIELFKDYIIR